MSSVPAARAAPRLGEVAAGSSDRIARDLVRLFEYVQQLPDKVQWVQEHVDADMGGPRDEALTRACAAIASAIDADAACSDRQPYHNRQHFCEVALTAYILCRLNQLSVQDTQLVLLAALIHDLVHDGGRHEPFEQERASVDSAAAMLARAGVGPARVRSLTALVLATDPAHGSRFAAAACERHADQAVDVPPVPAAARELADLLADASLARLARILCEADILPSVGLTVSHAMLLQDRLSREWGRPLDQGDKVAFIDSVLRLGVISEFFFPNVLATRASLAHAAHAAVKG